MELDELSTSPHFIGLGVACILAAALVVVLSRQRVAARLGARRRLLAALAGLALVLVGIFGNGVYGVAASGPLVRPEVGRLHDPRRVREATRRALDVALSEEFVEYVLRARGREPGALTGAYLRDHLEVRAVDPREAGLPESRTSAAQPPEVMVFTYYDATNFALSLLGVGRRRQQEGLALVQDLSELMTPLAALELYDLAETDSERVAALDWIASSAIPEWVLRRLERFEDGDPSPPVAEELRGAIDRVENALNDPSRRSMPEPNRLEP